MKQTGGKWERSEPVYFIAGDFLSLDLAAPYHSHLLCAINEMADTANQAVFEGFLKRGCSVLMDSGVFSLASAHAKKHGLTLDEARSLAPEEIDGFDALYALYVDLAHRFDLRVWGYIEIDIGGREQKMATRAKLEKAGLRPIPVYHPIQDGWDYFDYLAKRYDRICIGNLARTSPTVRKHIMSTMWSRRQKHPKLWVHMLGVTPNEVMNAWPVQSCDSSAWLNPVRWSANYAIVANDSAWELGPGFHYRQGEELDGVPHHVSARELCGYSARFRSRMMQVMERERNSVFNEGESK